MQPGTTQPRLTAEHAYLLRFEVLREVEYRMAAPSERAPIHGDVLDLLQRVIVDPREREAMKTEIARHARFAQSGVSPGNRSALHDLEMVYLDGAYNRALAEFRVPEAVALAEKIADHEGCGDREKSRAMVRLASTLRMDQRHEEALEAAEKARELAVDIGQQAAAWQEIGNGLTMQRRLEEALDALEKALVLSEESGTIRLQAAILCNVGSVLNQLGRSREGLIYCRRAAALADEASSPEYEGTALLHSGYMLAMQGKEAEAVEDLTRALDKLEGTRRRHYRVDICNQLGTLAVERGSIDEAEKWVEFGQSIARALGYRVGLIQALNVAAMMYDRMGRPHDAENALREAITTAVETGDHLNAAMGLGNLAAMLMGADRLDDAQDVYRQAIEAAESGRNRHAEALAYSGLGDIQRKRGKPTEAWTRYEHAHTLMELAGHPLGVLRLKIKLAAVQGETGETAEATQKLQGYAEEAEKLGAREEYELAHIEAARVSETADNYHAAAEHWGHAAAVAVDETVKARFIQSRDRCLEKSPE